MHIMSCGGSKGGGSRYHGAVGHARSVKSSEGRRPGEKGQAASGGARESSPDLDSTRADGRPEAGALVEREWDGGGEEKEQVGFGGVKNGAEERCAARPRRPGAIFKGGRCRGAARTPTGVPPPPPIGGGSRGDATRVPFAGCRRNRPCGPACATVRPALLSSCPAVCRRSAVELGPLDARWRGVISLGGGSGR